MNLSKTLWDITKGMGNATGLPYLINTTITNPIKQLTAQATGNKVAYRNAGRAYEKPVKRQLQEWGGNSASALLPFVAGGLASKLPIPPANSLAQKALLGMGQGGILGGAMNVTGTYGAGGDPTLKTFGQGALVGGLIGGASPLGRAIFLKGKPMGPVAPPRATPDELAALRGSLNRHYNITPGGNTPGDLNYLIRDTNRAAKRLNIPLNNGISHNHEVIQEYLKTVGSTKVPQYHKLPGVGEGDPDITQRLWMDYFASKPAVKGSGMSGEGARASSGNLSSQARRDALAKKMGYNIKRK